MPAVRLDDGRMLGYAEYGAPEGRAVLWFHGTPGARGQVPPSARAIARERDVRLVVVVRPGTGLSTGHPYDAVLDHALDVEQLADALDIGRFGGASEMSGVTV